MTHNEQIMYKPSLLNDILIPTEYFKDMLPGMLFESAQTLCAVLGYHCVRYPVVTRDHNLRRIQVNVRDYMGIEIIVKVF